MTPAASGSELLALVHDLIPPAPAPDGDTWAAVTALVLQDLREEAEEVRGAALEARIDPPPVHRIISAEYTAIPEAADGAPTFVFDLAEKPMSLRVPMAPARPPETARRIERGPGITRNINYPLAETAECQERELQRRARQRPPRTGTRKVKEAIRHWGIFEVEAA